MPTNEVTAMVGQALQAMSIGIPGVFAVLAVFYCTVRLLMMYNKDSKDNKENK